MKDCNSLYSQVINGIQSVFKQTMLGIEQPINMCILYYVVYSGTRLSSITIGVFVMWLSVGRMIPMPLYYGLVSDFYLLQY